MPTIENERPLKEVLQSIVGNIQDIVRSEVRLAKAEATDWGTQARYPLSLVGAGAVAGLFAIGLLLVTAVLALATVIPPWMAALSVAVVMAVTSGLLINSGRGGLSKPK